MQTTDFIIGVDIGNYDTKTSDITFLSGYTTSQNKPFGVPDNSYIKFNNMYYVLSQKRFPYVQDKTVDDKMAILTMIAIAKQMELTFEKRYKDTSYPDQHIKATVKETKVVHLGIGLPPSHLAAQNEKTISYYRDFFKNGVTYEYNGMTFSYNLGIIELYPQNFAVVAAEGKRDPESIMATYDDYYTLDFGGFTLDKICIENRRLEIQDCDSLEEGVVTLCEKVIAQVRRDWALTIDENCVINVLKGKKTILTNDVVDYIKKYAESWTHSVLDKIQQSGVNFKTRPVVFIGGTTLLLEDYIKTYEGLCKYEIIRNANANAEAYRKLVKNKVAKASL